MGQKTINIVYNVDTQQIVAAKAPVDAAKQATDQLNQSTQRLATQGGAAIKDYAVTITALKDKIQIQKDLIEDTARSDVKLMSDRIAKYKELQAELDKYNQSLQSSNKQIQDTGVSFISLGNTIRTVITAGLIKETISATLEIAKLAGQVDGVKRAFDKLPNSVLLMAELKEKTHGTLDELTLMQKAVQAQNFKIPLEQLGNLLEFAAVKAQQTGLDINYLTDSLITGLGRGSLKILDNLQFSITELKEKTKELGSQQAAVFFLVNEQMQKMGGYIENSATGVKQLEANWKELGQTIATSGTNETGFFVSLFNEAVKGAKDFVKTLDIMQKTGMGFNEALSAINRQEFINQQATKNALDFKKAHEGNAEAIDKEIKRLDELNTKERLSIIQAQSEGKTGESGQMEGMERGIDIRKQTIQLLKDYKNQLELNKIAEIGIIEGIDKQIQQLNEDLIKAKSFDAIESIKAQLNSLDIYKKSLLSGHSTPETEDQRAEREQKVLDQIASEDQKADDEGTKREKEYGDKLNKEAEKYLDDYLALKAGKKKEEMQEWTQAYKQEEKDEQDHQQRMNRLLHFAGQQIFTNARQIANELVQMEVSKYDDRIQALQDYYSNQETLAGTNQKQVDRLRKEEAVKQKKLEQERKQAQKKANIQRIEIDTAANVIRSIMENGGIPYGLPEGAVAAAMGLAQIALVNSYAKGVIDLKGPGTTTSDSIPSMLSRGESVMTAEETRNSGNILRNIRAKKLNDQVLDKLTITADGIIVKSDNSDVVNAIDRNKSPDYARQFSVLYETKETRKGLKRIIRSKSFND